MFGAFNTFGKLGAIGKAIAAAWSPLSLWPDGISTPGMWISPSTLDASFNDYTGTTPVAVPGTVADSANPVGLALDIRAGAPGTLGPELVVNGDFAAGSTGWTLEGGWTVGSGQASITSAADAYVIYQAGLTPGKTYLASFTATSVTAGGFNFYCGVRFYPPAITSAGTYTAILICGANGFMGVQAVAAGTTGSIDNISFKEVPGHHMLQATSAARPLESAYDGQTLGPGNTYDATGVTPFQLYDGVDDGMATASFAAGTLINGMDCMIAVRRDSSGTQSVCGLYQVDQTKYFGVVGDYSVNTAPTYGGCGTPSIFVDGASVTNTRGALFDALGTGEFHILEYRDLDLSTWVDTAWGRYPGFLFNGARGDILLFPSTASTEDKDAARQYLADKYGVTLP